MLSVFYTLALWWVMGLESVFEKICGGGDQSLCLQFLSLFKATTTKNCHISAILGNNTSLSWDFSFCCNLTNAEIVDFERLMSLLSNIHLTPSIPDAKA